MQARHLDDYLYAPGEFDTYKGREQLAAWQFADAYLLLWLKSQGKLSQILPVEVQNAQGLGQWSALREGFGCPEQGDNSLRNFTQFRQKITENIRGIGELW